MKLILLNTKNLKTHEKPLERKLETEPKEFELRHLMTLKFYL